MENRRDPDFMTFYCRGATAVLLKKADEGYKVLLIKRADSYEGAWCFVAGKIEEGEKAWQTVLREIREETNLVPSTLYSADIFEQFYQAEHEWIWVAPVFVGLITEQQKVKLNEEHSDYHWFTVEEAREALVFPGQRIILEHIEKEFIERKPCHWLKINTGRTIPGAGECP